MTYIDQYFSWKQFLFIITDLLNILKDEKVQVSSYQL